EPITEAPPPPDQAPPPLRGRQAPERKRAAESAPRPLLEAPPTVTVRPGESLFELAERIRTPVQALVEANDLKPPYDVTPGDVLK
ncbi:LysM peptidoglycan-binding domain-containing protein, partial [Escherichia coli]|uniref:LysM peptidoglycan-binding domain-containing protein n=1 Tax=Escherichia coli TaxID=562 RepID=UPI0039E00DED